LEKEVKEGEGKGIRASLNRGRGKLEGRINP
jgi:hypothetical protein